MDINKVDLLLKYILAAAGQEDYGNREVGPIHLVKYVYLADLAFALFTGLSLMEGGLSSSFHLADKKPFIWPDTKILNGCNG